jgi:hypothetical protein
MTSPDILALISEVSASRMGRGLHTCKELGTKACLEKNMEHVASESKQQRESLRGFIVVCSALGTVERAIAIISILWLSFLFYVSCRHY